MGPRELLSEAVKAVPAMRWAVAAGGVAAVTAIVGGFARLEIAAIGFPVVLAFMYVLVLFASRLPAGVRTQLATILAWAMTVFFIAGSGFVFTSLFFDWPIAVRSHIGTGSKATKSGRPTAGTLIDAIPAEQREDVHAAIDVLRGRLQGRLMPPAFGRQAWTTAELVVALEGLVPIQVVSVRNYLDEQAGPDTAGWRKFKSGRYEPHLGVSAWVAMAMARLRQPLTRDQLAFILSAQLPEGGWPIYSGVTSREYSSTYATAMSVLALQSHLDAGLIPEPSTAIAAVNRGLGWLRSAQVHGKARWTDYPNGIETISLSGLVVYTLHRCAAPGLSGIDRAWLMSLPQTPSPTAPESSNRTIRLPDGSPLQTDDTRYYPLQWSIAATTDAFPSGTVDQRATAITWMQQALTGADTSWGIKGNDDDDWIAAEMLIALRHLARR